jgi:hypothetical protein
MASNSKLTPTIGAVILNIKRAFMRRRNSPPLNFWPKWIDFGQKAGKTEFVEFHPLTSPYHD